MSLQLFLQIFLDGLMPAAILMLATMGIVLIFRTSFTTNFAQGMIATFSAFLTAIMTPRLLVKYTSMNPIVTLVLGMIIGMIVAFLIGLFIDTIIIRKSKNVTSSGKQMITMGLVLVITGLIPVVYRTIPIDMPRFSYDIIRFSMLGQSVTIPLHNLVWIIIYFAIITIIFKALKFTQWGLVVRATASNEMVAGMMGVNTHFITAMSWAIASMLGSIAAILYAPTASNITA